MKCGYVAVFGRANAGKSTLINKCLGFKLLPVSSKPQTTRDNVRAIYTNDNTQIIFVDTPGIFKPHGKLGSILLKEAYSSLDGIDVILYVIDASEKPNLELANKLKDIKDIPIIICFNKIDLIDMNTGIKRKEEYMSCFKDNETKPVIIETSFKDDFGVDDILKEIDKVLPERDFEFPDYYVSDRPKEYIIAEMVREKCMRLLTDEVPHSIYVDIKGVEEDEKDIDVYLDIIVEKESEKGIVIGKNGTMLKKIREYSEKSISSYFGLKAHLDILVKCIPNWRNDDKYLRKFGFEDDK